MSDALREVIEAMMRHRLRALATAFGVFWGIFMLTVLLGGGSGLRNGLFSVFEGARNMAWIEAGRTGHAFEGLGAGRQIDLDIHDLAAIERGLPEFTSVGPRHMLPAHITIRAGLVNLGLPIIGVYENFHEVVRMKAVRGRLLNRLDVEGGRKVVTIGQRARQLLFANENPVGKSVWIGGVRMTVVGEYKDPGSEDDNRRVYMPYTTVLQSFDSSPKLQSIVANSPDGGDEAVIRKRFLYLMGRRHRFDPEDAGAMEIWFASEETKRVNKLLRGVDVAVFVVGLGTLLSGMVGVSNILFVSVRERAKEFGIRRALGATARSILGMVLAEALLLASLAGGMGLLSALLLIRAASSIGVNSDYFRDPEVNLASASWALAALAASALVAGFFPAREAARVTPIEALRRE